VLLAALVKKQKESKAKKLDRSQMVVYCSDQTHAIVQKATMILGIGFKSVETSPDNRYALQGSDLAEAIAKDVAEGKVCRASRAAVAAVAAVAAAAAVVSAAAAVASSLLTQPTHTQKSPPTHRFRYFCPNWQC
jgi:glutamate/tyrosine decarboxylase-like PLP-dependent enzyme